MKNYWFILLILPLLSQAQSVGYDKLVLKFTPSSLLTPASPAWQFGVEYRPHKHFGINTDLATNLSGLRYLSFCGDCSGQKYYHTNFKWREEFRWYMPQRGIAEWFFAQEIFVTTDNFRLRNGYAKSDTLLYNFSKANHNVMGIGTASKFGVIYKLNSQVRLEIYA
ncbi:MAG: hypothetical protein MUE30_19950, partial [Spirosomaceae bacterium]|nr:hypothetical protein [Spirosomataceae bacterium]